MKHDTREGSVFITVLIFTAILAVGVMAFAVHLMNLRRLEEQRVHNDRALMTAEAGLAQAIAWLNVQAYKPTSDTSLSTLTNPDAEFSLQVDLHTQTALSKIFWTLVATATYNGGAGYPTFSRRVQATVSEENFAKYEYFVDYGPVWTPGYVHFYGFNAAYLGPFHSNSGAGFFPNLWFVNEVTSAAEGGVRVFADWGSYINGVYGKADADQYINIMQYYNSTYDEEPKFYDGLRILDEPIQIPEDLNIDPRASKLRDNAGYRLPQDYANYDPSAGPNFVLELTDPSNANNDGQVRVRQYLGQDGGGNPLYGPEEIRDITSINGAMIVYGDVVSLEGTLDGNLTIGAFRDEATGAEGAIDITGNVQYESRLDIPDFTYTDDPGLYTEDGSDINMEYVDTLLGQLDQVDDILGLVSESNVMVKEFDLEGNRIADDPNDPLYIDAIVMATGSATGDSEDGGYGVENMLTRPPGTAYLLGGTIANRSLSWALFNNGQVVNGIFSTGLWDQRGYQAGGAPPFFPSTGNLEVLADSWRSSFVANSSTSPWLPF